MELFFAKSFMFSRGTIIVEATNMFDCDMDIDKNTKIGRFTPHIDEVYLIDQETNYSECNALDLSDFFVD